MLDLRDLGLEDIKRLFQADLTWELIPLYDCPGKEGKACVVFICPQLAILMLQLDFAPPSSLARTEASFGRVHLTALRGDHKEQDDDDGDGDLFAVTHLNPNHGPETIDCKIQFNKP